MDVFGGCLGIGSPWQGNESGYWNEDADSRSVKKIMLLRYKKILRCFFWRKSHRLVELFLDCKLNGIFTSLKEEETGLSNQLA